MPICRPRATRSVSDSCHFAPSAIPSIAFFETQRAIITEETESVMAAGSEVITIINEECFFELDAPPMCVSAVNLPVPYKHCLEKATITNTKEVVSTVLKMFGEMVRRLLSRLRRSTRK